MFVLGILNTKLCGHTCCLSSRHERERRAVREDGVCRPLLGIKNSIIAIVTRTGITYLDLVREGINSFLLYIFSIFF